MDNNEYGFKLENIVNNSNKVEKLSNSIQTLKHNMNNNSYSNKSKKFYSENEKLLISLAEENITTVVDLNFYINWIKQYGKQ